MKRITLNHLAALFSLFVLLALGGCNSASYVSLNTLHPAPYTIPAHARSLVLVDNLQPVDVTFESTYQRGDGSLQPLDITTRDLRHVAVEALYEELEQVEYFARVDAYDNTEEVGIEKLSFTEMAHIRQETGGESLLALDGIRIQSLLQDRLAANNLFYSLFVVEVETSCRLYLPSEKERVYHFIDRDTLFWEGYGYQLEETHQTLPPLDSAVMEGVSQATRKILNQFLPQIVPADRLLFHAPAQPAMRDASRFWEQGKYKESSYMWEYCYENLRNRHTRALAAANLALYYESEDNLYAAKSWVTKALTLFQEKKRDDYVLWAKSYLKEIQQRMAMDDKLLEQLM